MNKTKKGFMLAGGIIGIVVAVGLFFAALLALASRSIIDAEFVREVINNMTTITEAEKIEALNHVDTIVTLSKNICGVIGVFLTGLAIANLILGIKVNKQAGENSNKRGVTIALLVISIISANMLTAAFMIVSLCLKFKDETVVSSSNGTQDTQTIEVK